MDRDGDEASRRARWLLLLYVFSGGCGLCFELLWSRQLTVAIGATSKAVSTVVAIFMAGLALGGATGARLAPRLGRPGRAYGFVEIAIGLTGAVVTWILPEIERIGTTPGRYATVIVLLLVPSTAMGLSFPLATQVVDPAGRRGAGTLYALNTLGAMLGCLLAGFIGIGLVGVRATGVIAAGANLACGAAALLIFRRGVSSAFPPPRDAGPAVVPRAEAASATIHRWLLPIAALSGAAALAAEILWTRALVPYLNSSTYSFAAILSTYLGGLACGAAWSSRRSEGLSAAALAARLGAVQVGLGVAVSLTPWLLRGVEVAVPFYVGVRQVTSLASWIPTVGGVFLKTAAVIGVPTFFMGASMPLCIYLAARQGEVMPGARAAGLVSAANTLGGIAGTLLAGFVLLPAMGVINALGVVGATSLLIAAGIALVTTSRTRLGAAVAAAGVVVILAHPRNTVPFIGRLTLGARALLVEEGPQDTTAVIERPGTRDSETERVIFSNGISYAGDGADARRYMGLLGDLPALLADDPSRALVICVGTGTTAAALARYDEVRVLDLVDISRAVARTLPWFVHVNGGVWRDPRTTIHEADGRQFMGKASAGGTPAYGVVTLEPPPPRAAGAASLYTRELYLRARQAMTPGGVIAQWLPLHGMTEGEILMLARTFLEVFPDAALFLLTSGEAALLGSPAGLVLDADRVGRRLADDLRAHLATIGFPAAGPEEVAAALLSLALVQGPSLAAVVGPGPVVTDDRPLIEQFALVVASESRVDRSPDGRLGLMRRLSVSMSTDTPPPRIRGGSPEQLGTARTALREQMTRWLAEAPSIAADR